MSYILFPARASSCSKELPLSVKLTSEVEKFMAEAPSPAVGCSVDRGSTARLTHRRHSQRIKEMASCIGVHMMRVEALLYTFRSLYTASITFASGMA